MMNFVVSVAPLDRAQDQALRMLLLMQEPTLRICGNQRAFALGDVSRAEAEAHDDQSAPAALPATAQVAFQQADYVAWNLWASMNGRALLPFRYLRLRKEESS
jgi:NADH:ubiquinone reductase (non-electrogenic)